MARPRVDDPKVFIFTALQMETRAVARALGISCRSETGNASGTVAGRPVALYMLGIGARRLAQEFRSNSARCVIMAGLAGALDPDLKVGDTVVERSANCTWHPPAESSFRNGVIHTGGKLVATPAEKAALFRQTGALAVDMENQFVREAAASRGLPFIGVRAISDTASETLDPAVLRIADEFGCARPGLLIRTLLRRPALIPYLRRLGANSKFAAEQLGRAVR